MIDPLIFPSGDIGRLAISGTVNDLAVGGAMPLDLSCAMIVEEGWPIDLLRQMACSMASTARETGVEIITGDTKVVNRGACEDFHHYHRDRSHRPGIDLGAHRAQPGVPVLT